MTRLVTIVRVLCEGEALPPMVMVDAQAVKAGRHELTFYQAGGPGGRTIGTKCTVLVEILGLPAAWRRVRAWLEVASVGYLARRAAARSKLPPTSRARSSDVARPLIRLLHGSKEASSAE
jgi:hypothetical protein